MDPRGLLRSPKDDREEEPRPKDDREKLFLCFTSIFPFIYKKHLGYFFTLSVKKTSVPQILLSRPQLQARHFNDLFEILDNTREIRQIASTFFYCFYDFCIMHTKNPSVCVRHGEYRSW